MYLTVYEITLISGGWTIIGALLGAWIGYRLSITLAERNDRRRACERLREAFKHELLVLNPAKHAMDDDPAKYLNEAFSKHETAVFDFAFFLKPKARGEFFALWHEYSCHPNARNENTVPFLGQYRCIGLTTEQQHEKRKLARSRIEKILDYAGSKSV